MPLADWSVPFLLRSRVYTNAPEPGTVAPDPLPINTEVTFLGGEKGIYYLRPDGCSLTNTVRQTKDNVPQQDGAQLHRRFLAGMEMNLAIQLWTPNEIACDDLLQDMLDNLLGYLYGLLNSGDNEGRISWVPSGEAQRMLDDIRLLSYPTESQTPGGPYEIQVTLDCARPYSENETQLAPAVPGVAVNLGNRPTFPVWQIYNGSGGNLAFVLTNTTTGAKFSFNDSLPGCANIASGEYVEIDTFRNSVTKVAGAVLTNVAAGVQMVDSDFFLLIPGNNTITATASVGSIGASSRGLVNAAWV